MKTIKTTLFSQKEYKQFIPQILISLICAATFTEYMKLTATPVIIFPVAICFYLLQIYTWNHRKEFLQAKWWYLIFAVGISLTLVVCKHMVVKFEDPYSDITANYILEYGIQDLVAFVLLICTFMVLTFCTVQGISSIKCRGLIIDKDNCEGIKKTGISNIKTFVILTALLMLFWLPYLILYYPAVIYGDSVVSIKQALGIKAYSNTHPFMFTMFVKLCISISHLFGGDNTIGCAIYSVLQMLYMAAIFSYSICWLRNKNISKKVCLFVFLFFALPGLWGVHAISMWKDPIFAVSVYFYSLKLFDLIYSKGEISKNKGYLLQSVLSIFMMCFSRHNGKYVAAFSFVLLLICTRIGKHKFAVKRSLIVATAVAVVVSWGIQGPVFRHFGIVGTAAAAYGVPLQQVARTVVYGGNISDEEKEFLNKIMSLEKYQENYSPELVDHIKWSEDFHTKFFRKHHKEFLQVWFSLLLKNPKLYVEAWALDTCGFWGLSYWQLNDQRTNFMMGVPKTAEYLEEELGIMSGSLLKEGSKLDTVLKKIFTLTPSMPSVALCFWVTLFMMVLAIVKGKWRGILLFAPCVGNILTLLIATPINYWPRYGLASICLLPISLIFPYLIMEKTDL